jgi:hypothetical protein
VGSTEVTKRLLFGNQRRGSRCDLPSAGSGKPLANAIKVLHFRRFLFFELRFVTLDCSTFNR